MSYKSTILAFAGSTRQDSYNKKLVQIAAQGASQTGADVTYLDLRDLPLPLFDEDLEAQEGIPANAKKLKELMIAHQGFLIASPEYNGSVTAVLKNAIDWASRPQPGEAPLACFSGKVAVLMSASPGALGGLRGLVHLRAVLGNLSMIVLPEQRAIGNAYNAFQPDGSLQDADQQRAIEQLGARLTTVLGKLNS
ncbi:MAG: NAD(P)H-dependent oxidoreductase [Coleofasciculaceae cyanobacterium SM2_1_6]|nr:NAD(P)H-dependent oxidoreductase [Coleofasciculaceae cyanobacterium SM2_1_6]